MHAIVSDAISSPLDSCLPENYLKKNSWTMLKYKISFVGSSGARGSQFGWLNYTDVKNGNLGGKGGVDY